MEFAAIAVVWTLLLVVAWTAVGRSLARPTRLDAVADRHGSDPCALRAGRAMKALVSRHPPIDDCNGTS